MVVMILVFEYLRKRSMGKIVRNGFTEQVMLELNLKGWIYFG